MNSPLVISIFEGDKSDLKTIIIIFLLPKCGVLVAASGDIFFWRIETGNVPEEKSSHGIIVMNLGIKVKLFQVMFMK